METFIKGLSSEALQVLLLEAVGREYVHNVDAIKNAAGRLFTRCGIEDPRRLDLREVIYLSIPVANRTPSQWVNQEGMRVPDQIRHMLGLGYEENFTCETGYSIAETRIAIIKWGEVERRCLAEGRCFSEEGCLSLKEIADREKWISPEWDMVFSLRNAITARSLREMGLSAIIVAHDPILLDEVDKGKGNFVRLGISYGHGPDYVSVFNHKEGKCGSVWSPNVGILFRVQLKQNERL